MKMVMDMAEKIRRGMEIPLCPLAGWCRPKEKERIDACYREDPAYSCAIYNCNG